MAQEKNRPTQLRLGQRPMRPNRPFYELLRAFPSGSVARSIALGSDGNLLLPEEPQTGNCLGPPMNIRQVAATIGCSLWTVRQVLVPQFGLPVFRAGASGKLIFYEAQAVHWIECQQLKGGGMGR
jgi:hypothetical protein